MPLLSLVWSGQVNVGIVMLERLARALKTKLAEFVVEPDAGAKPPKPLPAGRKAR
jgi:hypothetical protein